MAKDSPMIALSLKGVRGMGVLLILVGLSLPWVWLKIYMPSAASAELKGALRPELRRLPPGRFLMGSPESEEGRGPDEKRHEVEIKTAFAISVTEVTQGQYERVMGENPSRFRGEPDRPVENVTFFDAVRYCNKLSEQEELPACYRIEGEEVTWPDGLRCRGYRLPTEAEWEYAARADSKTKYAGSNSPDEVGWWNGNSSGTTHPVGSKRANAWGLHDLTGNVWEWAWDRYQSDSEALPHIDATGPDRGSNRTDRGGSWGDDARSARVATRDIGQPGNGTAYRGIRLARSSP